MEWWNDFVTWLTASATRPVLFSAAVLVVAIIVSALTASSITKAAVKRLVGQRDREMKAAAIAALIDASTEASVWYSLTPAEQVLADRAVGQADIHLRLLPIKGAPLAANWAAHQLAEMKRNSSTFGYELEPVVAEFRDRLVEWQNKPGRAKKYFEADLERWRFENTDNEKTLISEQDKWSAKRHRSEYDDSASADTAASNASTASENVVDEVAERERVVVVPSASNAPVASGAETRDDAQARDAEEPRGEYASAAPASAATTQAPVVIADGGSAATDTQTQKLIDDVAALDTQLAAVRHDDNETADNQRSA